MNSLLLARFLSGWRLAAGAGIAGIVLSTCDPGPEPPRSAGGDATVAIYVAASLSGALNRALEPRFKRNDSERPHNARLIAAASSMLARQLERGATGDVFVSANRSWMSYLQERDRLIKGSRRPLLGNRLVLVRAPGTADASRENRSDPAEFLSSIPELDGRQLRETLLGLAPPPKRFCIGDPAHVPAGLYARQALEKSGVWEDQLRNRILPGADARRTVWYLTHGGCAAGIVYKTDVLFAGERQARSLSEYEPGPGLRPIPVGLLRADLHAPIVYEIALLNEASPAARDLYDFLFSREAQEIFQSLGFVALD